MLLEPAGFAPCSDFEEVAEHPWAIAEEDDFAAFLVRPADWDFCDLIAEVAGDDQALEIESKSV